MLLIFEESSYDLSSDNVDFSDSNNDVSFNVKGMSIVTEKADLCLTKFTKNKLSFLYLKSNFSKVCYLASDNQ